MAMANYRPRDYKLVEQMHTVMCVSPRDKIPGASPID